MTDCINPNNRNDTAFSALRLSLFLWLLCLNLATYGQSTAITSGKIITRDLLFERFYSRDGLPDERIRTIFQDSKGFLWLGTMNGVARYDGYSFSKFYKRKQPNNISGNWAFSISEDAANNIWIGTREGLNRYDAKTNQFECFVAGRSSNAIPSNIINTMQFDAKGKLWLGTPKGLSLFDPITKKAKNFNVYPLNTNISKIIKSDRNTIWIATHEGVVRFNTLDNTFRFYKIDVKPNAYGDRFWSMLEHDKDLYLTTGGNGLVKLPFLAQTNSYGNYEFANNFFGGNLNDTEIFDITQTANGDVWLGTGLGLAKIEDIGLPKRKISVYKNNPLNNQSISNDQVFKVFIDKTDVLWCGTEQGLNKLDLHLLPFKYYTFIDKNSRDQVRSVFSKDGKAIWFGTARSGIYNYDTESNLTRKVWFPTPSLNANRSLLIDGGDVWNGTLGGAVKLNNGGRLIKNEAVGHAVFAFLKDRRGNVWVGTNNGLFRINADGTKTNYLPNPTTQGSISSKFVRTLYEDHNGNIWIGFENGKLSFYDPNTAKFINVEQAVAQGNIIGNIVFGIVEYPKDVFWVGTESGLNKITSAGRGKYKVDNLLEDSGLPDKSVNGIISDDAGNLWLGTIKGLVKFDVKRKRFQTYLNNLSFIFGGSFKVNNKCFLFSCSDGFVMFNPDDIATDNKIPSIEITDLKLFNSSVTINEKINGEVILEQSISTTKDITLDYDNNQFSIEFAALHFSNPLGNSYAYKLEGFNDKWTYVNSSGRMATYTNLNPGDYTFMVKASNYSGKWNETVKKLNVTILPPPWKTWWAIVLYILLLNLLLFVFVKYILIQAKQRQQIVIEKREKEQLKALNQMKVSFFTDISHEFRTPLSLIVGPTEDIIQSEETSLQVKTKAKLIYRNSKKLLYLLDELMTFQKMEMGMLKLKTENTDIIHFVNEVYENFKPYAEKRDINFDLQAPEHPFHVEFDPGKMEMVINNLLFNAFKFADQNGSVKLNISLANRDEIQDLIENKPTEQWLCIAVEDNGKGISKEEFNHLFERFFSHNGTKGTGVGLSLTKNLIEMHRGKITAESVPNQKTIFKVYLPQGDVTQSNEGLTPFVSDYDVNSLLEDPIKTPNMEIDPDQEKRLILIVDDNPEVLDYLEMIFSEEYTVARAENGALALSYILENSPDLIISDVMMPEIDGVALCEMVKTNMAVSHIPFILLSAKSTVEDRISGLHTGADDYIPKPFHPNLLKIKVANLIEAQHKINERFKHAGDTAMPVDILKNPLDEKFLNQVIDGIKANMSNDEFSVEELGSMVAMSRSTLFRKLKAITGQTPIEFIYYTRLRYGMELLLERRLNVSEIAYEVGFKNPSSFTKSFKKQFGKSPSEYLNDILASQKNRE